MGVGQIVFEYDLPVYVRGVCASSCFEFVLPAAKHVVAIDSPLFAVHSNPLIFRDVANEKGISIPENCPFYKPIGWLEEIYHARGLSYDFVELQREKTGDPTIDFVSTSDGCIQMDRSTYIAPTLWRVSMRDMMDVWKLDVRVVPSRSPKTRNELQ
ncbi:MAG: hypothetical protein Hens3KO_27580 [Henriciella sp.]